MESCQRENKNQNLTSAKDRSPRCFWRWVGVKVLLFGKILLLEMPDLDQVVGLFIRLFTGKLLLKRQDLLKVQYSAHACDVRKKNRSYEAQWG